MVMQRKNILSHETSLGKNSKRCQLFVCYFFLLFTIFIYLKPVLTLIDVFYFINAPQILSGSLLSPRNDQYQFSPNNIST